MLEINGLKFKTRKDSWDENIVRAIVEHLEYPVDIKEGDKVIDLGGHIGSFSILCASKGASVTVYEPHPDNFKTLIENIELNGFQDKIKAINKAVCDQNSFITTNQHNMGSCHLSDDGLEVESEIPLLDCDVLKIDCEGCEYNITIPKVRELVMELHPGNQNTIIKRVKSLYKKVLIKNSNAKGCKIIWARN